MTGLALWIVQVVSLFMPPDVRARYVEQWRADVLGARELGVSPLSIALGAVGSAAFVSSQGAVMQPIGPLAIVLRRTKTPAGVAVTIAAVLACALLVGIGFLIF